MPDVSHAIRQFNRFYTREIGVLVPLAALVILLGVLPQSLLRSTLPGIEALRTPGIQQLELQRAPKPPESQQGGNAAFESVDGAVEDRQPPPD